MFGNNNADATTGVTAQAGEMLSMEALLGKKVSEAKILEGGAKPKGTYGFQLTSIETGDYEIKQEEHARVGETAMMLTFVLTIIGVDERGKYVNAKGKSVSPEEMRDQVGKEFKENVMFGNDGLPKEDGTINSSGFDKLITILSKIIGEEAYQKMVEQGATTQQIIEASQGVKFLADISHNKWNDNIRDQLDLFGEFRLIEG